MAPRQPCLIGSQFARVGYAVRPALTDTRGGGFLLRGIAESDPRWAIHHEPKVYLASRVEEGKHEDEG